VIDPRGRLALGRAERHHQRQQVFLARVASARPRRFAPKDRPPLARRRIAMNLPLPIVAESASNCEAVLPAAPRNRILSAA
jgi:hypothetical protein